MLFQRRRHRLEPFPAAIVVRKGHEQALDPVLEPGQDATVGDRPEDHLELFVAKPRQEQA